MISIDDLLYFIDEALDGMVAIVSDLGEELANLRPDIPGTNTPYVILVHCLGVMEFWAGHAIAGRTIERVRSAEFEASGPISDLIEGTRLARAKLAQDLSSLEPFAPPRVRLDREYTDVPIGRTQGGVLLHIYEELAQHRGQMEVTRDLVRAPWAKLVPQR